MEARWAERYGHQTIAADLEFLAQVLPEAPATILDVPCGFGRHSEGLAARGYRVVAADLSDAAVHATHANLPDVAVVRADMAALPLHGRHFDAAICMGNSLLLPTEAAAAAFLRAIPKILQPGGIFVLNVGHRDSYVRANPGTYEWQADDGVLERHAHSFDPVAGVRRLTTTYTAADGRSFTERLEVRLFTVTELVNHLTVAGFVDLAFYEDGIPRVPTLDTPAVTVVCRTPG